MVKDLVEVYIKEVILILIKVLGYNNFGVVVVVVDGLVEIGEFAVFKFLEIFDGYNYGVRVWVIRVLVGIGDFCGLEILLDSVVNDFFFSVWRVAVRGLGFIYWEKLLEIEIN